MSNTRTEALKNHLSGKKIDVQTVKVLINAGAHPDTTNTDGNNFLHIAVMWKDKDYIQMALDLGADIHFKDGYNRTPLHRLLDRDEKKDPELIKFLIEKGSHPDTTNTKGVNFLHMAVVSKHNDYIQMALDLGADIHFKDGYNRTPLHLLLDLIEIDPDLIALLVKAGADPYTKNSNNKSFFDLAMESENNSYIKLAIALETNFQKPHKNSTGEEIVKYLQRNINNNNHQIKNIAMLKNAKEKVIDYIKSQPQETKNKLLDEALDKKSVLGKFFWTQRGLRATDISRGTLAILSDLKSGKSSTKTSLFSMFTSKKREVGAGYATESHSASYQM